MTRTAQQADQVAEYRRILRHRETALINRIVSRTPIAADLLVVLDSPIGRTIEHFLSEIAALTLSCAATPSARIEQLRHTKNDVTTIPSFKPAWATKRLNQLDRRLWEEAESVAGWLHHPNDPGIKTGCQSCGRSKGFEDLFCRWCGTPTSAAYVRCWHSKCANYGRRRMDCPPTTKHPDKSPTPKRQTLDKVPPGTR